VTTPRMLDAAGPQSSAIASLWDVFYYVSIAVWVLVIVFLIASAIVSRRNRVEDPIAVQPRDRRLMLGVVASGVATVITLVGLLIASIRTGSELAALEDDADALTVRITGRQWWWQIQYEPNDPQAFAETANELHVPVGKVVHLELTAADVIHSFWVPSVHGKKDLIPGRINRTWIRIDKPGLYRGQCAEFCGLQHAQMMITIIADPPEEFERWKNHQREPAAPPASEEQKRGLAVFTRGPCAMCHTVVGTPAGGTLGPNLTHFKSRLTIGAGTLSNNVEHLGSWIRDAQAIKPGARMPAIKLSEEDMQALVAFLEALQ
jgi:cytochrome c oxidase subunit II